MTTSASKSRINNPRTSAIAEILADRGVVSGVDIVVVGCGTGREAAVLADRLQAHVTGIDVVNGFDPLACQWAKLQVGDAQAMDFPDATFDVVFSYHALEHIPNQHQALAEMRRVLKPGGVYCIGTPNRSRLLGYIGGPSTLKEKIWWNMIDWKARLLGRFRNELGAHAGYTSSELKDLLRQHFATAEEVTDVYFKIVYAKNTKTISLLAKYGLGKVLFPSIYFFGIR